MPLLIPTVTMCQDDGHLVLAMNARKTVTIRQEDYNDALGRMKKWIAEGMNQDNAAELAAHQLRLLYWIKESDRCPSLL